VHKIYFKDLFIINFSVKTYHQPDFFLKIIILIIIFILFDFSTHSLSGKTDSTYSRIPGLSKSFNIRKLPFIVDDIMLIGGINLSGIYYSNHYQNLKYSRGYQIGIDQYMPIDRIMFLSIGLHYSQRNFSHRTDTHIRFKNNYLDLPLYVSFELPELKTIDLRFILGLQGSMRLYSKQKGTYSDNTLENNFTYTPSIFQKVDAGWSFGLSGEYRNIFFRMRSYIGINNLDKSEQGMMHSLNFDIGYFIFRPLRK